MLTRRVSTISEKVEDPGWVTRMVSDAERCALSPIRFCLAINRPSDFLSLVAGAIFSTASSQASRRSDTVFRDKLAIWESG